MSERHHTTSSPAAGRTFWDFMSQTYYPPQRISQNLRFGLLMGTKVRSFSFEVMWKQKNLFRGATDSQSACPKIHPLLQTPNVYYLLTRVRHQSSSWTRYNPSTHSRHISFKSTLMLHAIYAHAFQAVSSLQVVWPQLRMHFVSPPCMLHPKLLKINCNLKQWTTLMYIVERHMG